MTHKPQVAFSIKTSLFRKFIEPAVALHKERKSSGDNVVLTLTAEGLEYTTVDAAHVALVQNKLPAPKQYVKTTDWLRITVDVGAFSDYLKMFDGRGETLFSITPEEIIGFDGSTKSTFALEEIEGHIPKVPKLPEDLAAVVLDSESLSEAFTNAAKVDPHRVGISTNGRVSIDAKTEDGKVVYSKTVPVIQERKHRDAFSHYSADYLKKIAKAVQTKTVVLYLGNDYPLVVEWGGETGTGFFMLAPHIVAP